MKKRTKIINGLFLSTLALGSLTALSVVNFDNQNKLSNYTESNDNKNLNVRNFSSTYITASKKGLFVEAKNQLPSDVANSLTTPSIEVSALKDEKWFKPSDNALKFVEVISPSVNWNPKENMAVKVVLADDWSGELKLEFILLKNYSVGGVAINPPGGGIFPSSQYPIDIGYMNNYTVTISMYSVLGLLSLIILMFGIASFVVITRNELEKSNAKKNHHINKKDSEKYKSGEKNSEKSKSGEKNSEKSKDD